MYQESMEAIHRTLIQKGLNTGLTYTMELIPNRQKDGQTYAHLYDHLWSLLLKSTDRGGYRLNKIT